MRDRRLSRVIFFTLLFVFSAAMLIVAMGYRPLQRMFPVGVLSVLTVLVGLKIVARFVPGVAAWTEADRGVFQRTDQKKYQDVGSAEDKGESQEKERTQQKQRTTRNEMAAMACIAGAVVSIYLFGYQMGAPLFTVFYSLFYGRRRILPSLALAAAMFVVFYVLFNAVIPVRLFPGLLFDSV